MDNDIDYDIANFCAVTSATPQVARDYLQIADNNVEMAITLYLENGGSNLTPSEQTGSTTTATTTTSLSTEVHDNDNNEAMSDEALARQLQEQEESRQRRQQQQQQQQQSSEVRAPIAPRTEILTGGGDGSLFDMSFNGGLWGGTLGAGRRQQHDLRSSVFNQGDSSSLHPAMDILRGSVAAATARTASTPTSDSNSSSPSNSTAEAIATGASKAKRLADLFRPPFDIMFRGGFEEARTSAREQSKWLLVNVQDPTEFACQVLNRDLWSDNFVKDIVRESFVFLQYANETPEGKRYATLYPIIDFPHVAIIDPRTGERIKSWDKKLTPTDFMMEVTEFLEQHSPDVAKSVTTKKPRQNVSDMSEEEQLNAAIAASLQPKQGKLESSTTQTEDAESLISKDTDHPVISDNDIETPKQEEEEISTKNLLDSILPVERKETTDMANSTRIQFRMADGKRVIRRFLKTDPVRYLFEFIKTQVPESQDHPFELVFNRQQLIDILDQTIDEAGLQNAAVNVQFA